LPPQGRATIGRWLLPAAGLLFQLATALTIESGSPDALCPALAQAREAIGARLGTLQVNRPGWRARYTTGHAPDSTGGDFVRLEVFDPDGVTRLQRDLPKTGLSCVDMAQALALVVDHYFRSLTAEPAMEGETRPVPSPAPPATWPRDGVTAGPGASGPPPAPPPLEPRPRINRDRSLLATAGVAVAARPSSAGVSLGIATTIAHRLEIGLSGVALVTEEIAQTPQGTVTEQSFPLRLWSTYTLVRGDLEVGLGPEWLGAIEYGKRVDRPGRKARLIGGVGARASVRGWATPRVSFGVTGSLDLTLAHGRFLVGSEEVLAPGPVQGLVALEITWLLLP
jgi:hypothetical protein